MFSDSETIKKCLKLREDVDILLDKIAIISVKICFKDCSYKEQCNMKIYKQELRMEGKICLECSKNLDNAQNAIKRIRTSKDLKFKHFYMFPKKYNYFLEYLLLMLDLNKISDFELNKIQVNIDEFIKTSRLNNKNFMNSYREQTFKMCIVDTIKNEFLYKLLKELLWNYENDMEEKNAYISCCNYIDKSFRKNFKTKKEIEMFLEEIY